jgi:membrane fusion protein, copper/silver efflux system
MFEARNVEVGQKFGDKYQVLSGLNENDEVAASGGFLIDSESQLKTGKPTGHQHDNGLVPTEQEKSSTDDMKGMDMPK